VPPDSDPHRRKADENLASDRRETGGRRETDSLPRTTLTRKVLVVVVALINLAYLVSDTLLSNTLHGCF